MKNSRKLATIRGSNPRLISTLTAADHSL